MVVNCCKNKNKISIYYFLKEDQSDWLFISLTINHLCPQFICDLKIL